MVERDLDQRASVFRETRAPKPGPRGGISSDAIVEPDARDLLHVGADFFGKIGDLVDEGDLGGEERVGRVFDQLRGAPCRKHQRRLIQRQRPVDIAEHFPRTFIRRADTIRSGNLKSRIAAPSRRNSGLEAHHVSRRIGFINQPLHFVAGATGTVDLVTTTVKPASTAAISRAAVDVTQSAWPSPRATACRPQ